MKMHTDNYTAASSSAETDGKITVINLADLSNHSTGMFFNALLQSVPSFEPTLSDLHLVSSDIQHINLTHPEGVEALRRNLSQGNQFVIGAFGKPAANYHAVIHTLLNEWQHLENKKPVLLMAGSDPDLTQSIVDQWRGEHALPAADAQKLHVYHNRHAIDTLKQCATVARSPSTTVQNPQITPSARAKKDPNFVVVA